MIRRPSNSGTAIWVAASSGETPSSFSSQAARGLVRQSAWSTGTSRPVRAPASQDSSSPCGRRGRGLGAARREDGGHYDVRGTEFVDELRFGRPERGYVQREGAGARVLHGRAERLDERGVPAHVVGAVVEHRDGRAGDVPGGPLQRAPGGRRGGRLEAVAGEQHGVGEEAGQLLQVGGAAVREVGVRLRGDADGHGRRRHQLCVGGLFTCQYDDGPAGGQYLVQPLLPRADTTEEAYDDQVGPLQQLREVVEESREGLA